MACRQTESLYSYLQPCKLSTTSVKVCEGPVKGMSQKKWLSLFTNRPNKPKRCFTLIHQRAFQTFSATVLSKSIFCHCVKLISKIRIQLNQTALCCLLQGFSSFLCEDSSLFRERTKAKVVYKKTSKSCPSSFHLAVHFILYMLYITAQKHIMVHR